MALKPADGTVAQQVCRVCGGEVNPHGECVVCGTKQDAPAMADKGLPSWLKTESGEATTWLNAPGTGDSRDEALRKWLSGEDTAFQDWIGVPTTSGGALTARATPDRMSDDKVRELRSKAMEVDGMRAELESMRATLNRELSNFRQGKFDPVKYIEETATLSKQLQTEIAKRKELEQEIEHIKKGSIAVIKYVKTQQLKAGTSPEMKKRLEQEQKLEQEIEHIKKGSIAVIKYVKTQQLKAGTSPEMKKRLEQEQKLREEIETESAKLRSVNEVLKKQIESGFAKLKPDQRDMKRREADLMEREAALRGKEERIAAIHPDEVNAPTEELKRRLEEELREMEQDYLAKEEQFKKRIISLEGDVNRYKIEDKVRVEAQAFEGKPRTELGGALTKKEHDVLQRERTLLLREQDLQRLQDDLQVKEDEIKKVKEPLAYKEEELLRREEDMLYREKLVQAERRKVEEAKAQGGSTEELDMKARLEELKSQINQKEEEVRTK
ncbi:MAG: hypothetical protein E6J98_01120, partial [Methanobacteriota archaeon]